MSKGAEWGSRAEIRLSFSAALVWVLFFGMFALATGYLPLAMLVASLYF